MSDPQVEMKTVLAHELRYNNVFEMFGNLYQIDAIAGFDKVVGIHAHLIAQIGTPRSIDGRISIHLDKQTPVSIEA